MKDLLEVYLGFLQGEEDFFAILARELPFYPESLRRRVFFSEAAVRSYFYAALVRGIAAGDYCEVDATTALTFLFGTISYLCVFR